MVSLCENISCDKGILYPKSKKKNIFVLLVTPKISEIVSQTSKYRKFGHQVYSWPFRTHDHYKGFFYVSKLMTFFWYHCSY